FRADEVAAVGNTSYAHTAIYSPKSIRWGNTFSSTDAVFANRGPLYAEMDGDAGSIFLETPDTNAWELARAPFGRDSDTLKFAGSNRSWSGNVAYNDGHVSLEPDPDPVALNFTDFNTTPELNRRDNLFVDEENEGQDADVEERRNHLLRIWAQGIDQSQELTENAITMNMWVDGMTQVGRFN
ncbi:MAG: hypothetical protein VYC34_11615, partial [Planctomycetota bacterium]|nr:hypothetical protein [Planctomycetota bacterium]